MTTSNNASTAIAPAASFTFDMTLDCTIRVSAESKELAAAMVKDHLQGADTNFGAWPNGDPVLGECSVLGEPVYFDHEAGHEDQVLTDAPLTAFDRLVEVCMESLSAWDGEEESVKAEHAELIAKLRATLTGLGHKV